MCLIDGEPFDAWDEKDHKAKKTHRCSCCWGPIQKGEMYTGSVEHSKVCGGCQKDRLAFSKEHLVGYQPSYFLQGLRDCVEGVHPLYDPTVKPWRDAMARVIRRRRRYPKKSPKTWSA